MAKEKKSSWKDKVASLESTVKSKIDDSDTKVQNRMKKTTKPEDVVYRTWGWFWALIAGLFASLAVIVFAVAQGGGWLLTGLLALVAAPVWLFICLRNMIPEIKIFGFTIYSKDRLSIRQQLSVGGSIAKIFTREFFRTNPWAAWSMVGFGGLFILSIILAL
ncbi:MAG: hypothetical protein ACXAB4_04385 [Candidatus Hodarchaeales archaeon]|jgi:hypothetical protein